MNFCMAKYCKILLIVFFASLKIVALGHNPTTCESTTSKKFWIHANNDIHKGFYGEESLKESEESEEDSQNDLRATWVLCTHPSLFISTFQPSLNNFIHPFTTSLFHFAKQLCVLYLNFRL